MRLWAETLVLNLTGANCRSVPVGRARSSSRAAANLAMAAGHIAAMLQLPVEVAGDLASAHPGALMHFSDLSFTPRPFVRAA